MKYYIIAGEASGDLHAANLIKEIKQLDQSADFRGWGGDKMQDQGVRLVKHYRDTAYMGFVEVLLNLRKILTNINFCKKDIHNYQPDAVILVDYPGFNLRIADFVHNQGIKVFYYISPQLWAWKKSRIKKIKAFVDRMFVILPFEKDFYEENNYEVDFVGHPLLDELTNREGIPGDDLFRKGEDRRPIIALLPGSRKQEIATILEQMLKVTPAFHDYRFIIGGLSVIGEDLYAKICRNKPVEIIYDKTYQLLSVAEAALVTSGTATLEAALINVPEIICYKGSYLSYQIAKRIVDVNYIGLVNLVMDKPIVTELIQGDLSEKNLILELGKLLNDSQNRDRIFRDYNDLRLKLGGRGASERTAKLIQNYIKPV